MSILKKKKDAFVLSDGNVENSYGFYVLTSGISLKRFKANPVMLDSHINGNLHVLGNWSDLTIDEKNGLLLAAPNFDQEDPEAAKIAGKVKRGFIKGASIGINFNREDLKLVGGKLILTKCELLEASIVAIPSNANALKLYCNNEELSEDAIGKLCLSVSTDSGNNPETFNKDNSNMSKIVLGMAAMVVLGFKDPAKELSFEEVDNAVLALGKQNLALTEERDGLKTKLDAYVAKEKAEKAALSEKLVDGAIKAGKFTADKRDAFLNMAKGNYELAKETIEALPGRQSFNKNLKDGGDAAMTMEAFQKLSLEAQLQFKAENPEAYTALVGA